MMRSALSHCGDAIGKQSVDSVGVVFLFFAIHFFGENGGPHRSQNKPKRTMQTLITGVTKQKQPAVMHFQCMLVIKRNKQLE